MKQLYLLKQNLVRRVALFYIFIYLFNVWLNRSRAAGLLHLLMHSVCCNITWHLPSKGLHCTFEYESEKINIVLASF